MLPLLPAHAQGANYQFVATFDTDEKLQGQLERLKQLGGRKAWAEWVTLYQQLLDERPDGVVAQDAERFTGLRVYLERLFAQAPPEARQLYRNHYDAAAKQLWDRAVGVQDPRWVLEVYNRYRQTVYGRRALLWLANRDLDSGEFEHARLAFARLSHDAAADTAQAPWVLLKWALAAARVRRTEDAAAALDQLAREYGNREMRIGGRTMPASEVAQRHRTLLAASVPQAGAAGNWPAFAGERGDRRMAGEPAKPLSRLWQMSLSTPGNQGRSTVMEARPWGGAVTLRTVNAGSPNQISLPVSWEDRLIVQSAASVQCVRAADGKLLWTAKEPFEMNLPRPVGSRFSPYYSRAIRTVQGVPVTTRGRVFVRMPVGNMEGYGASRWPADYSLAALDGRTGEPIWLRLAGASGSRGQGSEATGSYYNLPTLRSNTVYTGIATPLAGLTEFRAAAVDAGAGEHRWTTYLGTGSDPMTNTDGSPPAVGDGIVWIESSLHTLNALDALTGDILWIYRYHPRPLPYYRSGWQDTMTLVNEPISLIAAPGGRVLFAPRWGEECVALDARTGKLLWSAPKGEARTLFAVDDQRCYLCGDEVRALDLATGARRWSWTAPDAYSGMAAMAGNRVYAPAGAITFILDAGTGREAGQLDLRKAAIDPGYSAITVIGDRLFLSLPDRLVAFGQGSGER